jgi:hypothetical protein
MKVVRRKGPLPEQPFGPDAVPISLRAKGRKIPGWQLDHQGLLTVLQPSPARTTEPVEELTLIPMGAARLRITAFPIVSPGPDGRDWLPPKKPVAGTYRASASHCFESDTLTALSDGLTPEKSGDQTLPRFTWWPRRGSREWVEYQFAQPTTVDSVAVYWFDDTGMGSCRVPAQWRLLAREGEAWVEVKPRATPGVAMDQFNRLEFPPVTTTGLRIDAQLQPGFSAGILEWQVKRTK